MSLFRRCFCAAYIGGLALLACTVHATGVGSKGRHYQVIESMPGPNGAYGHAAVDPYRGYLYVARGDGVMRMNLMTGDIDKTFIKGAHVSDVLVLPNGNLVSTNKGTQSVDISSHENGKLVFHRVTGAGPDAVVYDALSRRVYVIDSDAGDVTVIDPDKGRIEGTIPVGGQLGYARADGRGHIYITIRDEAKIAVLDTRRRKVMTTFTLPGCEEPTGLGFDPDRGVLLAACRNSKAVALRTIDRAFIKAFDIDGLSDDVIFDAARCTFLIPCARQGLMYVIRDGEEGPNVIDKVHTAVGAHTAALDQLKGWLCMPDADYTVESTGYRQREGTFHILLITMK